MHVAFAVTFFFFVGLCETLRHGVFGLSPVETNGIIHGALVLSALLLLRSDVIYTMYCPKHPLYGYERLNWTLPRTALGAFLGPVLWIVPVAYGFALIQINVNPISTTVLFQAVLVQGFLIGIAEGLFFREAVLKSFSDDTKSIYVISLLSLFIFHIPSGVPQALIAAGAGMYFLTLRLIGANILLLALIHGVTVAMFSQILTLDLTQAEMWPFAVYFISASAALSVLVFMLFATPRWEPRYA